MYDTKVSVCVYPFAQANVGTPDSYSAAVPPQGSYSSFVWLLMSPTTEAVKVLLQSDAAETVSKGLSGMKGNFHVPFLGEGARATGCFYPTLTATACPARRSTPA